MSISEKKQEISKSRIERKPLKTSSSIERKGLFEKKKDYTRPEFREILKKASPFIPGAGGRMYSRQERIKMEKELFPYERFKSHISETEVKRRFRELRKDKYNAKTGKEKIDIDRTLRFLENITGVKPY